MERTEQHVGTVVENILRAIAVMEIHIKNCHAGGTRIAESLRCYGRIVQEAITAIEIVMGMMPRRPAQGEG